MTLFTSNASHKDSLTVWPPEGGPHPPQIIFAGRAALLSNSQSHLVLAKELTPSPSHFTYQQLVTGHVLVCELVAPGCSGPP